MEIVAPQSKKLGMTGAASANQSFESCKAEQGRPYEKGPELRIVAYSHP